MEVQVGGDKFILLDIGHHLGHVRILVRIKIGGFGNTTNGTADFYATLGVNGIHLAFQQILVVNYRGSCTSHSRCKEGKQRSFHFHIHF